MQTSLTWPYLSQSQSPQHPCLQCTKMVFFESSSAQDLTAACCRSKMSDWLRIRIIRVDQNHKGHLLEDVLDNTKGASPLWTLDNKVSSISFYH